MSARVLVVDDLAPNVKLLEAKLSNEYFQVLKAHNGQEAIEVASTQSPDLILLDVMMPGIDGYEVCRRLKSDSKTMHIPIVMVTALSEMSDMICGLDAGADDFLTKPVNDMALISRVKSLVRLKMTVDEWRRREETSDKFGVISGGRSFLDLDTSNAHIIAIEASEVVALKIRESLSEDTRNIILVKTTKDLMERITEQDFDLVIVGGPENNDNGDSLRLCSMLRSNEHTRQIPILLMIEDDNHDFLAKGLEIGINDYLAKPVNRGELLARARTQIRRRRYQQGLRNNLERNLSLALTDSLTGLYNRRYANVHLSTMLKRANESGKPVSLLMIDIDHFKKINDTYGHAAGDDVLCEISQRIVKSVRDFDMVARLGGEEFLVVLPDVPSTGVKIIAERLREMIADRPFDLSGIETDPLQVTVSIGASLCVDGNVDSEKLIKIADQALYEAKNAGRNQVVSKFPDSV